MRKEFAAPPPQVSERRPGKPTPQRIREHLVRCIWYEQHLSVNSLTLDDGRPLAVASQGWWNIGAGPDFTKAEITIDGAAQRGDIEVHTYSSDWYKHNHNQDPAYNDTVLHVAMWNDRDSRSVKRYDGSDLPQLTLSRHLSEPLGRLEELIDLTEYPFESDANAGVCRRKIGDARTYDELVGTFLDLAGDWRMLTKAQRFGVLLKVTGPEEALYCGLMEAMGYPANKVPFRRLAESAAYRDLRAAFAAGDISRSFLNAQALLFERGGLAPRQEEIRDDETREYAKALSASVIPAREALKREEWQFKGMRPQNYPFRRAAAVALLYAAHSPRNLFEEMLKIVSLTSSGETAYKALEEIFVTANDAPAESPADYWLHRNTYTGRRSKSPQRLISENLARNVIVNITIPLYLAFARKTDDRALESNLHRIYEVIPRLPATSVTRFMRCRIFGEASRGKLVRNARRQQALYQIFRDYCDNDDAGCANCVFLKAIEASSGQDSSITP
jgi:hypothetical protein